MSENNTRARPTGWTLSVSQAKLDREVNRGSKANAKYRPGEPPARADGCCFQKGGVAMARVLIGGRRGVAVRALVTVTVAITDIDLNTGT